MADPLAKPIAELQQRAKALMRPGDEFACATDQQSAPGLVLVAIERPGYSLALAIDRSEFKAREFAELAGFKLREPTAMEKLKNKARG